MNSDLQHCYQRNLGIGTFSTAVVAFAFALWVNSLDAPEADVTVYGRRSVITTYPFAKKIHIQGGGEPGNKIGISQTVNAQSGAGEDSLISERESTTELGGILLKALALSALESRLDDRRNVIVTLIDSRRHHLYSYEGCQKGCHPGGKVDSTRRLNPLAVLVQRRL